MEIRAKHAKKLGLAFVGSCCCLAASANAQSTPAQSTVTQSDDRRTGDRDTASRQELSRFDQFLDSHREISEQLRKDPSLANNAQFLKSHPALQTYLQDHPGISSQLRNDPNQFMREEMRYDRREDNGEARRQELARFDQFLDSHKTVASQVRKDPSLMSNAQFLADHPELRDYLQSHPQTKEAIQQDPNGFMREEERYDRREDESVSRDRDRDRDTDRNGGRRQEEMAKFDQFLGSHREVAEQLRRNPELANDPTFLKNHPGLETYLQQHPMVKEDLAQNPNALLREEARYQQREPSDLTPGPGTDRDRDRDTARYDGRDPSRYNGNKDATGGNKGATGNEGRGDYDRDRSRDAVQDRSASFGSFLGTHSSIAQQLSSNPSLANDKAYLASHPELQSYLSSHPEVREELTQNPQGFVKAAQQYNKGTTNNPTTTTPSPSTPTQPKH